MCWPWDCRDRRVKVAIGHCKAGQGGEGGKPDEVYFIYIYKYVLVLGIDIRFGIDIRYILVFCTTWHVLFCILYVVLLVVAMMEIVT